MRRIFYVGAVPLLLASMAPMAHVARAQAPPPPPAIQPVPIPGGDVVPPVGIINIFSPGVGTGFDGMDAEPHVFTNFRGVSAMGYTLGTATDNSGNAYQVITDIRVFKGEYIGGTATFSAGGTTSAKTHGTFVEIWIDFWLPSSGTPTQMVHDFNPGIGANGLWWLLQVPDDAVTITEDAVHVSLKDAFVVDQFSFPGGAGDNLGAAGPPAKVSFDVTYTKTGSPRRVRPTSNDPIGPFDWAGEMWMATNSGTFSVSYNDGSFSASGSFDSVGNFGEVGFERNGLFVREDEEEKAKLDPTAMPLVNNLAASSASKTTATSQLVTNVPTLRGHVPLTELIHRH